MFWVTGLKILGRVKGRHTYILFLFFLKKKIILCNLKGISKCIKSYFFPEKPEKSSRFHHYIKVGSGYPKRSFIFLFGLMEYFSPFKVVFILANSLNSTPHVILFGSY